MINKHGFGTYQWASGNVYKGEFVSDQREGYGEMYWIDGSVYKGMWKGGIVAENNQNELSSFHAHSKSIENDAKWMAVASRIPFNQRIQVENHEFSDGVDSSGHEYSIPNAQKVDILFDNCTLLFILNCNKFLHNFKFWFNILGMEK